MPHPQLAAVLREVSPYEQEVQDDIDGEQETVVQATGNETQGRRADTEIFETIQAQSQGALTDRTVLEYNKLFKAFVGYASQHFSKTHTMLAVSPIDKQCPEMIIAWIMASCDDVDPITGLNKPHSQARSKFGQAQKMRAAVSHHYGRVLGLGQVPWTERENGTFAGNPSVSVLVSQYMVSLRRRKIRAGEAPMSARAITVSMLQKLYEYNQQERYRLPQAYEAGTRIKDPNEWAGARLRAMLHCIYVFSFLCLLRCDEALKIQAQDITFETFDGTRVMVLSLPFRKTAQTGEIKPFYLHRSPEAEAHLCPFRAYADWILLANFPASLRDGNILETGYIFRRFYAGDRISVNSTSFMLPATFLECFRNNIVDLGLDAGPYGTHSFRRGGCQWLSSTKRKELRQICDWGGWSQDFTSLQIVKYLTGWNDRPQERREDFLNPIRPAGEKCYTCGRTCDCA